MRRVFVHVVAALALLAATTVAGARGGADGSQVFHYPTDLSAGQLRVLLQSSTTPTTVIFEKAPRGAPHVLAAQLFVFARSNLTLCGATGRPQDVVLELQAAGGSPGDVGTAGMLFDQVRDVTLRDLTLTTSGQATQALRLQAVATNSFASYVEGVTIDHCQIEADRPIVATAEVRDMTVVRSTLTVAADDRSALVWGDGTGLYVTRTRFRTSGSNAALHGIEVQGAAVAQSDGERAARIILTRNDVRGDFVDGFHLSDVREVRVRGNRIRFSGDAVRAGSAGTAGSDVLRTGIFILRDAASAVPDDFEVRRNRVRGAGYGMAVWNADSGVIANNDFRRCGSTVTDEKFGTNGGALHMVALSSNCHIGIERNDFRSLRSPDTVVVGADVVDVPAVTVVPEAFAGACFTAQDGDGNTVVTGKNKVSRGRRLFAGADQ